MGRLVLGAALRMLAGAGLVFAWPGAGWAQVPVAAPSLEPAPPPPPAAEPVPVPPPAPAVTPAAAPRVSPAAAEPAPPPLDPPASAEPASRPAFLHTREEMERIRPARQGRERPPRSEPAPAPESDFVARASPWVDLSLVSFALQDRASNFLNVGVQFGGYLLQRLRVSARLVTPLEAVSDGYSSYDLSIGDPTGQGAYRRVDARSMSLLYGVTVGLAIANRRSFVFGPSVELLRTDVEAYGSTLAFGLPFEWTTQRDLRVGFELALGHSFGGSVQEVCRSFSTPSRACGERSVDRPSGTSVILQFNMGWALGRL